MRIRVAQLRLVVVFVLLGLGVSVVVAEWCAVGSVLAERSFAVRVRDDPGALWKEADWLLQSSERSVEPDPEARFGRLSEIVVPEWASDFAEASRTCSCRVLLVRRGAGVHEETLSYIDRILHGRSVTETMIRRCAGWPLCCLAGTGWNSERLSSAELWAHSIGVPEWLGRRPQSKLIWGSRLPRRLLLEPIPMALAANSGVYALFLFLLWMGRRRIVLALRRRRNRCLGCNYSRAGLGSDAACPECGRRAETAVRA